MQAVEVADDDAETTGGWTVEELGDRRRMSAGVADSPNSAHRRASDGRLRPSSARADRRRRPRRRARSLSPTSGRGRLPGGRAATFRPRPGRGLCPAPPDRRDGDRRSGPLPAAPATVSVPIARGPLPACSTGPVERDDDGLVCRPRAPGSEGAWCRPPCSDLRRVGRSPPAQGQARLGRVGEDDDDLVVAGLECRSCAEAASATRGWSGASTRRCAARGSRGVRLGRDDDGGDGHGRRLPG